LPSLAIPKQDSQSLQQEGQTKGVQGGGFGVKEDLTSIRRRSK
jgi:hypothetical protein